MWEGIDKDQKNYNKLTWIVDGMQKNTMLWVTDGSYNRRRGADLSGVGWVIMCTKTGNRLTGSFWERSLVANS